MNNLDALIEQYQNNYKDAIDYLETHKILLTYNSTTLEGATLDLIEVELLIKDELTPQGKPLLHSLMVKDHYDALTFVLDKSSTKERLSEEIIKTTNGLVRQRTGTIRNTMLGSFDERKGDYRLLSVYANVKQDDGATKPISYPDCKKVPAMMREYCIYLNTQMDKVKTNEEIYNFSFDAHYHLRRIHPFSDGNSRTSRLVMNYIQHYFSLPVTPVSSLHRLEYIKSFYASSEENPFHNRNFLMKEAVDFLQNMVMHEIGSREAMAQSKHKKT